MKNEGIIMKRVDLNKCNACGSRRIAVIINGRAYCEYCASKVLTTHVARYMLSLRNKEEGLLIPRNIHEEFRKYA